MQHSAGEPIGQLIRRVRTCQGMTQAELADRLATVSGNQSVTRDQVTRWEGGRRVPSPYWRGWLGTVLGLPHHQLDQAAAQARAVRLLQTTDAAPHGHGDDH